MVLCLGSRKKFKAQAGGATNKDVWKHLQLLAPPNCLYMQRDKDALKFSCLLKKIKKIKKSKFSRNKKSWYSKPSSPKTPEVEENFDGKPADKKTKRKYQPNQFQL